MRSIIVLVIALSAAFAASVTPAEAADGKNRKVLIENASSQTINYFYAAPITSSNWEEDLLGAKTILASKNVSANIDNGTSECFYDLKAKMADGKEHVRRNVNVCSSTKWVITDSGDSIH